MKVLILINSLYEQYEPKNDNENCILLPMLKSSSSNKFMRTARKAHLHSFLPFKNLWFYEWEKLVYKYDTIILADTGNVFSVAKYIHKRFPLKRIIIWYRNPVIKSSPIINKYRSFCEIWSFDKKDCEKYNMKYNPQFCMRSSAFENCPNQIDAFFVGVDKGRLKTLLNLEKRLNDEGLKTTFLIVNYNFKRISYHEVVEYISKSKIIVDLQSEGQDGFTLRPIEALLYRKKLITNNIDIIKYDFYSKSNIFVLGIDDIKEIRNFCKTPYVDVSLDIVEKYDIYGWVRGFNNE